MINNKNGMIGIPKLGQVGSGKRVINGDLLGTDIKVATPDFHYGTIVDDTRLAALVSGTIDVLSNQNNKSIGESFANALFKPDDKTLSDNGAVAYSTTHNAVLDFYSILGAARGMSYQDIISLFEKAYSEDKLLTLKAIFYARNIRGGLGERRVFRTLFKKLIELDPRAAIINLHLVPHFGRWDDLYATFGTVLELAALDLIKAQITEDLENMQNEESISLLCKWLKSTNTKNKENKEIASKIAKHLNLNEKKYRKLLKSMRSYISLVESKMSQNEWTNIEYSSVPSKAMANYRKAFERHDEHGFSNYIEEVKSGNATINSSTLYPYDILRKMGLGRGAGGWRLMHNDDVMEEMWKSLPNYAKTDKNILVVADTSASMTSMDSLPITTALGLAIYFAERNHGVFSNRFITFSWNPCMVELEGQTLYEKVRSIPYIVEDTNMEAVFDLILETAIANNLPQSELPASIVVITDMQFNSCVISNTMTRYDRFANPGGAWSFYETIEEKYLLNGYQVPNVVFWNVNADNPIYHATSDKKGVQFVSGHSPAVFKQVISGLGLTPYEAMLRTLNDPVYEEIRIQE